METDKSEKIIEYFARIESEVKECYRIGEEAHSKGLDPDKKIAMPLAQNMAERVEGLVSVIAPEIKDKGIPKRIAALEKKFGIQDWRVALSIALEIAEQKITKFSTKKQAIETAARVGFAYITMGVVASPIEGLVGIDIKKTRSNKEYFSINYSGPVRSAGGTGASVSVLIIDYLRKKLGYDAYDPTEEEIKRQVTELYDYHERITNLQYLPSTEEIEFMVRNLSVQIDGDPSEKIEVSNFKDLDRISTNNIRSGICLVIGEGLCQKAQKLWKQLSIWGKDMDLANWGFLEEFLKIQKISKAKKVEEKKEHEKVLPNYTYIKDLVAGRPVLAHPLASGGFRLRYGRSRNSGYSSACISPATTYILDRFIGIGTQLKVERPGKSTSLGVCDSIEGPICRLKNGNVVLVNNVGLAKKYKDDVDEILYLGDILVNYGDFLNRAHPLIPAGYCEEWWIQEFEKAVVDMFGNLDLEKAAELIPAKKDQLEKLIADPFFSFPDAKLAIKISESLNIPLHPKFTYHWNQISNTSFKQLVEYFSLAKKNSDNDKIILPSKPTEKRHIEIIGLPHDQVNNEFIVLDKEHTIIVEKLILEPQYDFNKAYNSPVESINSFSKLKLRDKSGYFIGARMGRPEKAKMRKMTGSPHCLFPVGEEGGKMRSFITAMERGKITGEFPVNYCSGCDKETIYQRCEHCDSETRPAFYCKECKTMVFDDSCGHTSISKYRLKRVDIKELFSAAMKRIGDNVYPEQIKGVKGTSNKSHIPEHLTKGILRAKHNINVNKDGTIRYDMTQVPLTHFTPAEIGTPIESLKSFGYEKDIYGKQLTSENQVIELFPQDVVLPASVESPDEGADKILFRASRFIDELLQKLYGLEPYYNAGSVAEIAGHLAVALAPHTSAGIVVRIIGFSKTQGFYAHPLIHAATRRDCDGDEASVTLLLDALINFSPYYLPNTRGATQDAPLVLTSKLIPAEVDDMVFDLDVAWKYPLEFYEATLKFKEPYEVNIDTLKKFLNTPGQYEGTGFTHPVTDINKGVKCSSYKVLPTMEEKLKGQMDLAGKIRAVDESDVAKLVIERHFLRDIKGNLRKFSQQQFRCVNCNEKFRRPPLLGRCTKCNGKIVFTISEGSIVKYLEPAISLAKRYNLPAYIKQTLELTKQRVEEVFGKDADKQVGLGSWFN